MARYAKSSDREVSVSNSKRRLFDKAAIWSAGVFGIGMLGTPCVAFAQAPGADSQTSVAEVIVTAQRREQSLQDVPIAVTALSAEEIRRNDVSTIEKLQGQSLGLVVATGGDRTNLSIRGIGSTITSIAAEAGVPVNIDGVYMTRTTLTGATYADLAQIEVLRGPQGTLYGRNATGGTVNITTKTPDGTFSGDASVLAGNGGRYRVRAAAGLPLDGESLSARIAFDWETLDGYRQNVFLNKKADPEDHVSGRAVVRWAPSADVELLLRASISADDTSGPLIQYGRLVPGAGPFNPLQNGGLGSIDPRNVRLDRAGDSTFRDQIYSATLNWDLDWATLKSITAHQNHKAHLIYDRDGTSRDYISSDFLEESPATTQEVTLSGSQSSLDWLVGGWYLRDNAKARLNFRLPGLGRPPFTHIYRQRTEATAIFGQATYSVLPALRLTAGLRYSDETKTATQTVGTGGCTALVTKNKYDDLSPRFGIDFDAGENVMLYASASKGFKAGGGNVAVCGNTYGPETLWAYEGGFKSQWLENRVRLNVAAYYYDYKGYQATQLGFLNNAPVSIITNAASATAKGVEAELQVEPARGLTLEVNAALADSKFGTFITANQFGPGTTNLAGNRLVLSPKFSGTMAAQYVWPAGPGSISVRAEHRWTSTIFFDVYNRPFTSQSGYGLTNLRLAYTFDTGSMDGLEVAAFVNNLEDKDILNRADASGLFGGSTVAYAQPRTYGVELRYQFR